MNILLDFLLLGAIAATLVLVFMRFKAIKPDNTAYKFGVGVALAAAFLLFWVVGAVGVIGASGDRADLMYAGVLAVGVIGALIARFEPRGMARAMLATALAQALVGVIALVAGMVPAYNSAFEILGLTGFFAALWGGSAWLFRKAARKQPPAGAEPTGEPAAG